MKRRFLDLSFDYTPQEIDRICSEEIQKLMHCVDRLAQVPKEQATFDRTVLALESACSAFSNRLSLPIFLKYVSTAADVRAAADRAEIAVQQMMVELLSREDLYQVVKAQERKGQSLNAVDRRLLEEYLVQFRRNGLELTAEKRALYIEKKKRLVAIEAEYSRRLVEWDDGLELEREELSGLPQAYIDALPRTASGKYRVTLQYPHYNPFMENATNASARQRLELKYLSKGGEKNRELLEEALRLRQELAALLGYPTHAHFVLERRMAKTPDKVLSFLLRLRQGLLSVGQKNLEELLQIKREQTGDKTAPSVLSYELRYWENQLRKQRYQIDNQAIKEYFPLEIVLQGMLSLYEEILGVTFRIADGPVWHPSVSRYEVWSEGEKIAIFYMDLFPREGKYGHAAAFTLVGAYELEGGTYEAPVSAVVANFNPPTQDIPSLLEHSEVETLFHEFGHIMHQILTKARYATFSGTNVKTDFVEAPSQMLENWVWEESTISRLSGHYRDPQKKLPKEWLENLIRLKRFNVGLRYLRQLGFALIDMQYHTGKCENSTEVYRACARETMLVPIPGGAIPQAGFGHLMGGYDAGYYGYLWSEVYAQDMFTRFEQEGLTNRKTGQDYRKWILEPGGSEEPGELIRGFLGRDPDEAAFLRSIGL